MRDPLAEAATGLEEVDYRFRRPLRTARPGAHTGSLQGAGMVPSNLAPLMAHPDPRRIHIRASAHDPFGQLHVQLARQPATASVQALVDRSASMGFRGRCGKLELAARLLGAMAFSALRTGDAFGLVACGGDAPPEHTLPPNRDAGLIGETLGELADAPPQGGADLEAGIEHLDPSPSLVLVVSDFHFPVAVLQRILERLDRHQVVPIVLWDSAEWDPAPGRAFVRARDPETGAMSSLLLRPGLRRRLADAFGQRRRELNRLGLAFDAAPLFVIDRLDIDAINAHFAEH